MWMRLQHACAGAASIKAATRAAATRSIGRSWGLALHQRGDLEWRHLHWPWGITDSTLRSTPMRARLLLSALFALALLAVPAIASASTLTRTTGAYVYTGSG